MSHSRRKSYVAVAALAAGGLLLGAVPAMAHGGSVSPTSEQQDCRSLELNEKGEGGNAEHGTSTAGENGSAADWSHCG